MRSSSARYFCIKVSPDLTSKMSPWAGVMWRLDWCWRTHFGGGALTSLSAKGLSFVLVVGPFQRPAGVSLWHGSWLLQEMNQEKGQGSVLREEKGRSCPPLYDLILGVMHHPLHHSLFVRSESLSPAYSQGVRMGDLATPLRGEGSNNLWTFFFKPPYHNFE